MTATQLNGRAKPNRKAKIEAIWEEGDGLIPTGNWSKDHEWIEVYAGESGTAWCHIRYLSEWLTPYNMVNVGCDRLKIRSKPVNGHINGYLKKGKSVEITQVVLGWGKCTQGWIDMRYLAEEEYTDEE